MSVTAFDHVNVLTSNLAAMVEWYDRILGMKVGPRPPFSVGGAWLYLNDEPILHLVEAKPDAELAPGRIEHFALRAEGLQDFRELLSANDIQAREFEVPGAGILQLNIHDPDGNHIHVDFRI